MADSILSQSPETGLLPLQHKRSQLYCRKGLGNGSDFLIGQTWVRTLLRLYLVPHAAEMTMKYSNQIKPISYLKSHTAELVKNVNEQREPYIITQNGEAKVVMQDIKSYEQTQEVLALLKILALGNQQIAQGQVTLATDAFASIRASRNNWADA